MSIVIMSMMPKSAWRDCCSKTMLSWYSIKTRMPWNVILMFGAVGSFTKLATHYQLVKKFFDKLGTQFWTHGSKKANQYILMCVAAVFSEIIHSGALAEAMAPIVINIATDSGAPPVFYLVPVSLAASVNIIMPISLPLIIIREYLDIPCLQMFAYGAGLKFIVLAVTFASMNTLGTLVFAGNQVHKSSAAAHFHHLTGMSNFTN
ncbi:solute carrier family 13 member 2-like [Ixodes scapularis]|uniref:solute carrier family 13 member 2-like n=1 Tax=Ixodes scapularis TaxID=6945 RepID=UPI001A9F4D30|nr:solute carrier family 13 member 2-like [Ixodes scapularis]